MKIRSRQNRPASVGLALRPWSRRGVVILEFILALPLLVILLMAVVEFSLIYQVNQQVAYASKYGAKLASEVSRQLAANPRLGNFNLPGQPPLGESLKERVDQYLATHRLTNSCSVVLRHTACSIPNTIQQNPDGSIQDNCHCGTPLATQAVPGKPIPADVAYVQVTVAVPLTGNVPDLLGTFGFPLGTRTCIQTTTMRIEPNNTPPEARIGITSGSVAAGYSPNSVPTGLQSDGHTLSFSNAANPTQNDGSITIALSSSGSTDAEEQSSGLHYQWAVTGTGASVDSNGNAVFPVPGDPNTGPGLQGPNIANYVITLTVTDGCDHHDSATLNIHIETHDSDPTTP